MATHAWSERMAVLSSQALAKCPIILENLNRDVGEKRRRKLDLELEKFDEEIVSREVIQWREGARKHAQLARDVDARETVREMAAPTVKNGGKPEMKRLQAARS